MFSLAYGSAQFGLVLSLVLLAASFSLVLQSLNVLSTLALECKALMPTKRVTFKTYSVSNMIGSSCPASAGCSTSASQCNQQEQQRRRRLQQQH
jgi:hypothetical protein